MQDWAFEEKVRWIELMEKFEEIHSIRPLPLVVQEIHRFRIAQTIGTAEQTAKPTRRNDRYRT